MISHLPILQVVLPLLAAPACLIFVRARSIWLFTCLACLLTFGISVALFIHVSDVGPLSYEVGGWPAPWGIEYTIDSLSSYVLLLVSAIAAVVILAANSSLGPELPERQQPAFYVLFLLCLTGLLGIVATGDVFNVFVFLEVSSLATYALIALGRQRQALWAAYQYLIVGTIGASFFLVGIGFLYALTGTLNMSDLSERLVEVEQQQLLAVAFGFVVVGIALKMALLPLHGWLPNAYAFAPSIATTFLAASATKVSLYLFIRLYYGVFGAETVDALLPVSIVFLLLGIVAVLAASLVAFRQSDVKRMLAFSSIAQIGYMAVGIGVGSTLGLQASLLHLFNHAFIKGALFLAVASVVYRTGSSQIDAFRGLGYRMPWTMAGLVLASLSLIGVPLTAGFVSKWFLVLAAIESGLWVVVLIVLVGSFISLFYLWKIVELAYSKSDSEANSNEAPPLMLIALWVLVIANIYFGIDTRLTVGASASAAATLIEGAPW